MREVWINLVQVSVRQSYLMDMECTRGFHKKTVNFLLADNVLLGCDDM
jgi:hypothetical protein